MNKKWIMGFVIGAVIAGGGYGYMVMAEPTESDALETVQKSAVVAQGDIIIDFVSDGNVEIPIYDLSFETTGGTVEKVNVKVGGDYVESGTVLAELEKMVLKEIYKKRN